MTDDPLAALPFAQALAAHYARESGAAVDVRRGEYTSAMVSDAPAAYADWLRGAGFVLALGAWHWTDAPTLPHNTAVVRLDEHTCRVAFSGEEVCGHARGGGPAVAWVRSLPNVWGGYTESLARIVWS